MTDKNEGQLSDETISKFCENEALMAEVSLEQQNSSVPYKERKMQVSERVDGIQRSLTMLLG